MSASNRTIMRIACILLVFVLQNSLASQSAPSGGKQYASQSNRPPVNRTLIDELKKNYLSYMKSRSNVSNSVTDKPSPEPVTEDDSISDSSIFDDDSTPKDNFLDWFVPKRIKGLFTHGSRKTRELRDMKKYSQNNRNSKDDSFEMEDDEGREKKQCVHGKSRKLLSSWRWMRSVDDALGSGDGGDKEMDENVETSIVAPGKSVDNPLESGNGTDKELDENVETSIVAPGESVDNPLESANGTDKELDENVETSIVAPGESVDNQLESGNGTDKELDENVVTSTLVTPSIDDVEGHSGDSNANTDSTSVKVQPTSDNDSNESFFDDFNINEEMKNLITKMENFRMARGLNNGEFSTHKRE
ncbi:uncharacterized protein LOC106639151 [Copidosoma floridanum]|uniref:uncharacterized protein LOC106639151 n=1 Tax=Copidosoma floridanum TaxID=29053 RepID=UPI0006C9705D|nr:uncharacterized protein LOC106639151 [Copidosoma floridanum]